jgi:hypothetical protein
MFSNDFFPWYLYDNKKNKYLVVPSTQFLGKQPRIPNSLRICMRCIGWCAAAQYLVVPRTPSSLSPAIATADVFCRLFRFGKQNRV